MGHFLDVVGLSHQARIKLALVMRYQKHISCPLIARGACSTTAVASLVALAHTKGTEMHQTPAADMLFLAACGRSARASHI